MHQTGTIPKRHTRGIGMALLLYAVTTAVSLWLGAQRPITFGSTLVSAAVIAAGTVAMALYLVRWTPYPRWAFLGAAAAMVVGALAGPLVAPGPAAWAEDIRPMLWMNPWFLMVMAWESPASKRHWCSPSAPWAGGLLIGSAALLTLASWAAAFIARRI